MTLDLPTLQQGLALAERAEPPTGFYIASIDLPHYKRTQYVLVYGRHVWDGNSQSMLHLWDKWTFTPLPPAEQIQVVIDDTLAHRALREKVAKLAEECEKHSEETSYRWVAARLREIGASQ